MYNAIQFITYMSTSLKQSDSMRYDCSTSDTLFNGLDHSGNISKQL